MRDAAGHSSSEIRVDRILLQGLRDPAGRWILGANACTAALFLVSPWEIGEVLVAFWLEAVVVAVVFAVFVAQAPTSGPTLGHRAGRIALWLFLAGGFLALTGAAVFWTVESQAMGAAIGTAGSMPFLPPVGSVLGPTPWIVLAWLCFRAGAAFSDVLTGGRPERGIGLAAARFFVVYLPVLAGITGIFALAGDAQQRILPLAFLALLTYYELILAVKLLPLLDEEDRSVSAFSRNP